jgi:hypothetical protein
MAPSGGWRMSVIPPLQAYKQTSRASKNPCQPYGLRSGEYFGR